MFRSIASSKFFLSKKAKFYDIAVSSQVQLWSFFSLDGRFFLKWISILAPLKNWSNITTINRWNTPFIKLSAGVQCRGGFFRVGIMGAK